MKQGSISNLTHPLASSLQVGICTSFVDRLMGLMFRKTLSAGEGILLVEGSESKLDTSIHMLFMNFDIAVIWLDSNQMVVDRKIARSWSLAHFPQKPAKSILEISSSRLDEFNVGDHISIRYE